MSRYYSQTPSQPSQIIVAQVGESSSQNASLSHYVGANVSANIKETVLLATALVQAKLPSDKSSQVRALVDPGSEVTFISSSLAKRLNLKVFGKSTTIIGVGKSSSCASTLYIRSRIDHNVVYNTQALVLDDVTSYLPRCSVAVSK